MKLPETSTQIHKQKPYTKLLIVDDQAHQRSLMTQIFRDYYRVTTVCDGPTALAVLKTWEFDVALVDIRMPRMNGLQVLEEIRKRPQTEHLPVILISAETDNAYLMRGLEMGANDYITKPLDSALALARVKAQVAFKKTLDQQLQKIRRLEEIQREHDRLVQMITHDLKHPVMNLRMAEVILRDTALTNPDNRKIMDGMVSSLDAMEEVLDDFKSAFEVGTHTEKLNLHALNARDIVYDAVLQYTAGSLKKNIMLDIGETEGKLIADHNRVSQVIGNLLSNAIKYSPYNSTVRIWTETCQNRLRISVADEGPGVPSLERNLLFTEFGRLSTRPTGHETSTGLGLWIVKNLTEAMQGRAGAEFPENGGSVFWVELPAFLEVEACV